jgi:release factor glutamine methyltransferase
VVVSNPPYVQDGDRATMAPEVVGHEPKLALFAGADGLRTIRPLLTQAAATRATTIALEVGAGQAPAVAALVVAAGFPDVDTIADLAGHERVLVGKR